MVFAHAQALLLSEPGGVTDYIEADVRDPATILERSAATLDFSQPVALVMLGILGQLPDAERPHALLRRYLDALPPGSYLALCDGTDTSPALNGAVDSYNKNSASSYHLRGPDQVTAFFDGLTPVAPGVVPCSQWQREGTTPIDVTDATICGVAVK